MILEVDRKINRHWLYGKFTKMIQNSSYQNTKVSNFYGFLRKHSFTHPKLSVLCNILYMKTVVAQCQL